MPWDNGRYTEPTLQKTKTLPTVTTKKAAASTKKAVTKKAATPKKTVAAKMPYWSNGQPTSPTLKKGPSVPGWSNGVFTPRTLGTGTGAATRSGSRTGAKSQGGAIPKKKSTTITSPSAEWNQNRVATTQPVAEEAVIPGFGKSLADYIASIGADPNVAAQLAAFSTERNAATQRAGTGDASLAAMYAALRAQTDKDSAASTARYAQGQQAAQGATDTAQANLSQANAAAQADQNTTLANLGVSGANDRPGGAAGVQEEYAKLSNSGVQQTGNASMQQLISQGNSQADYSGKMATAADFTGAGRRADLQTQLSDYLNELGAAEAEAKSAAQETSYNRAKDQYNADYQSYWDQQNWSDGRDDQAYSRAQNALSASSTNQPEAVDPTSLKGQQLASYTLQSAGVPSQDQNSIMQLIFKGASMAGTSAKGIKTSSFQAAYQAIQDAIASGTLDPSYQGAALSAAATVLGT